MDMDVGHMTLVVMTVCEACMKALHRTTGGRGHDNAPGSEEVMEVARTAIRNHGTRELAKELCSLDVLQKESFYGPDGESGS